MAIWDLFSKRQADAAKSGIADVYQYDNIPKNLRVQVAQISIESVGVVGASSRLYGQSGQDNPRWAEIERIFCRERGVYSLQHGEYAGERVIKYMHDCPTDDWLDLLEILCFTIIVVGNDDHHIFRQQWEVQTHRDDSISEINYRLKQAGVGFQFETDQLIRIDSQFIHSEIVKPAIDLLSGPGFSGPRQEFLAAHQHYRNGENRQAVSMAANALESTFKAIFDSKRWQYPKASRISDLVKVARSNQLWPDYLDASFDQLVATLQSGLPKIRDNDASHGQGAIPKEVAGYIAAYALHLAASKIVFLVGAARA